MCLKIDIIVYVVCQIEVENNSNHCFNIYNMRMKMHILKQVYIFFFQTEMQQNVYLYKIDAGLTIGEMDNYLNISLTPVYFI